MCRLNQEINFMKDRWKLSLYTLLVFSFLFYTGTVYQQVPTGVISTQDALRGKMLWQDKNCTACHQLYGLGGFLGPDLTNVYSAPGKSPDYLKGIILSGTTTMPAFQFSSQEMEDLLAFLQHVDASGLSDPKQFDRKLNGTIESE